MKKRKVKSIIFALLAALSIIYYAVCISYAWVGVSWLWIWPLFALFCLIRAVMLWKMITVPKWLRKTYTILIAVFGALFIVIEAGIISGMRTQPKENLDYIITLGAAIRNGEPTSPLILRIDKTIEYLQDNPDTILIASGGQGPAEDRSEAECIAEYVMQAGISQDRIILEQNSSDTEENIEYSFRFTPENSTVGIVTSSFHIRRALLIARLDGYTVSGVPAVTLLPLGIHYTVREFFGIVQLFVLRLLNK